MTEDEMVGWHHRFHAHEFEEAPGVGDGQGSLGFMLQSMGCLKELDITEQLFETPHGLQHAWLPCPSPTLELAQTHVHGIGDAIQPSHSLSSLSPPAFNLSQHKGLFQ